MELHIAFGYSAAADLRAALAGREVAVARFSDNLSYGPINPPESSLRRTWISHHLGFDNPDVSDDEKTFWPTVLADDASRIAWFSRRSAAEYCAFLEYLRRLGDRPTQIVDTTNMKSDSGEFFRSVSVIPANYIVRGDLLSTARDVDSKLRDDCRALWESLRADNAAIRFVDQDLKLSSAPLELYDGRLLVLVEEDWRSLALVVGDFLGNESADVSDLILFSRLYAMVDVGVLEMRDVGKRHPEIRLARP
ncbi:MAG TPA: DUF3658 domain-containing protein [Rhizomicrobium sp.]|nr:DUF3658 domain-containing protein [Rhizomicrobium sp.]